MIDKHIEFAQQFDQVRPLTRSLIQNALMNQPSPEIVVIQFGIDGPKHQAALYNAIRAQEVSPKDLDAAMGDGQKLTALVRAAASNPHKDVEFQTAWNMLSEADRQAVLPEDGFKKLLEEYQKDSLARKALYEGIER